MNASATVTGVTGAGQAVTALAVPNISDIDFDYAADIVSITYKPSGNNTPRTLQIMLSTLTTITATISGSSVAWVLS